MPTLSAFGAKKGHPGECPLGGFALEAGLLVTGGCLGLAGCGGGGEVLLAVLLRHLLAEGLEALGLGAEAADLYAAGFLWDEIAHERDFLTQSKVACVQCLR